MNIIYIDGGLGNQMFQYALALKMQSLGTQVKLDVTKYADHHAHNGFELDRVFRIGCSLADEAEIRKVGYLKENHWTNLLKKSPLRKKTVYTNESYAYDPEVLTLDGCYIEGYWQSERYFLDIRDQILEAYRFAELTGEQRVWADRIHKTCSVSVHIRRGDYLRYPYLQNICTMDYYEKAMRYFRENCREQAVFYIFTNDIPWAREHFPEADCCFVEGNTGKDSFRDMQLMSLCRHHVIANSSFSWWGAWLDPNPDKIVIAPGKWVNNEPEERVDIFPENWIRMEG